MNKICSNCMFDSHCVYQTNTVQLSCELHTIEDTDTSATRTVQEPANQHLLNTSVKDLCSMCDHRNSCSLRDNERFVFHCEEYQ